MDGPVKKAAALLKNGGLLVFPTETVYGIGADLTNKKAIKRLFSVKERPKDKPFQVLISDFKDVKKLCAKVPLKAGRLMKKSWPGPLTVILKKKRSVPGLVTAGLDSVGIRMPDHPFILEVIKALGNPIVASSANISGKRPPRTAKEATKYFKDRVALVIDAGKCKIGRPSKIIDATRSEPITIRK
jgi:L-threonylcarbamoyladenylate synthase